MPDTMGPRSGPEEKGLTGQFWEGGPYWVMFIIVGMMLLVLGVTSWSISLMIGGTACLLIAGSIFYMYHRATKRYNRPVLGMGDMVAPMIWSERPGTKGHTVEGAFYWVMFMILGAVLLVMGIRMNSALVGFGGLACVVIGGFVFVLYDRDAKNHKERVRRMDARHEERRKARASQRRTV